MAKLVDLLAKHLKEWPDGAEYARQDVDKEICFIGECTIEHDFFIAEMAEDAAIYGAVGTKKVYMKDWLAARDRLHAETVKDMREPTNADHDQALWDKVASESMAMLLATVQLTEADVTYEFVAETACNSSDAFMAERAKRILKS